MYTLNYILLGAKVSNYDKSIHVVEICNILIKNFLNSKIRKTCLNHVWKVKKYTLVPPRYLQKNLQNSNIIIYLIDIPIVSLYLYIREEPIYLLLSRL